jgi:tRNA-splicing ligase RtcB (3'-phosphate/5'-hydroxy nucleic acid ligase)
MNMAAAATRPGDATAEFDVSVFDSADAPADRDALHHLQQGLGDTALAAPPVVLPDFHHKGNMEMPSSIAVATRDSVWPILTSASVNCGMALVALDIDRPGAEAITDFYRRVRERLPYPPTYRRDLTPDEVVRAAAEGSHFAVDRYGVDPGELTRVEHGGWLDLERFGGAERVRRELPWSVRQLSRIRFGTIGKSNHFIELQQVEEVYDAEAADLLGLRPGQVTLQFHGGGGSLPGEVGVLYGRRRRYPKAVRMQMAVQKPLYHLGRARSLEEARRRRELYFADAYPPVPRESREGEQLMLANLAAMNYGFAFRLCAYANLRAMLDETFGAAGSRLVVDSPHNAIYEEEVDGERAIVHRHNASRVNPADPQADDPVVARLGLPLLLPGTNRTSSYVCVPDDDAPASLNSTCHGAGSMIKDFVSRGISGADPEGRSTLRYNYAGPEPERVEHYDDRGVDEAMAILRDHRVARPVVRLRPFAVMN